MREGGPVPAPPGHVQFCHHRPEHCVSAGGAGFRLSRHRFALLDRVNRYVNGRMIYVTDPELYRQADFWMLAAPWGDCEDFALTKRMLLMRAGFPPNALRLTLVEGGGQGLHLVLTAVTDRGDFILDNQHNRVLLWSDPRLVSYNWLSRTSGRDPSEWVEITNTPRRGWRGW